MAKLRRRNRGFEKRKMTFRNVKRKTVSQKLRESESFLGMLFVVFICVASVSYILQTNSLATRGYEVEEYEKKLNDLKYDNQVMKNQEAELRSIKNLETEQGRLSAIASSDIDYVTLGGSSVAMRK